MFITKKKLTFFFLFVVCSCNVFAAGSVLGGAANLNFRAMDLPLLDGISYFVRTTNSFANIACYLAYLLSIICICWNAFRLWMGTQQVRKAAIDIITKCLLFIFLFYSYSTIRSQVIDVSMRIGSNAGNGIQTLTAEFNGLRDSITSKQAFATKYLNDMLKSTGENGGQLSKDDIKKLSKGMQLSEETLSKLATSYGVKINENHWYDVFSFSFNNKNSNDMYKNMNEDQTKRFIQMMEDGDIGKSMSLLTALNDVLVPSSEKGNSNPKTNINTYLFSPYLTSTTEDWTKLNFSKSTYLVSPGTMIKTGVLIANVLQTSKDNQFDAETGTMQTKKFFPTWEDIRSFILMFIMTLGIIFSCIFCIIQYVMCIFEYFITTSIGVIFIPFVLWDGTKSFAAKLVTLFTSFFIKIVVTLLCLFFTYSMYIKVGLTLLTEPNPDSLINFAYLFFVLIIGFVVTQNAPQVALTVLNGSPQLSMGEFLHAAGTAAAGAAMAKKAAGAVHEKVGKPMASGKLEGSAAGLGAFKGAFNSTEGSGLKKFAAGLGAGVKADATQTAKAWGSGIVNSASKFVTGKELVGNKKDSVGVGKGYGNKIEKASIYDNRDNSMSLGGLSRHYQDKYSEAQKSAAKPTNNTNPPDTDKKVSEDDSLRS